jgi:hypothetical protein
MFLQTNVCESSSKPTGRPLLELALRLLDCQPDSFTTDADRDAGTTGRRLVVGLRSCFVQGGVNLGTALVVTPSGRTRFTEVVQAERFAFDGT